MYTIHRVSGVLLASVLWQVAFDSYGQLDDRNRERAAYIYANYGGIVTIPVTLNGESYLFGVDPGSPVTIVDTALIKHLGRPIRSLKGGGGDGSMQSQVYELIGLEMESLQIPVHTEVLVMDLGRTRRAAEGADIRGLIGMNLLRNWIVHMIADSRQLYIFKGSPYDNVGEASLAIDYDEKGLPHIRAEVSGLGPRKFLVTLSFPSSVRISADDYDFLLSRNLRHTNEFPVLPFGRQSNVLPVARPLGLRLTAADGRSFQHDNLVVNRTHHRALGYYYWSRYECIFDFPKARIFLVPGKCYLYPDHSDRDGIRAEWKSGGYVLDVPLDSQGFAAGLRSGDRLLTVNEVIPDITTYWTLVKLLSVNDRGDIRLSVDRDGERHNITLRRPPAIHPWRNGTGGQIKGVRTR